MALGLVLMVAPTASRGADPAWQRARTAHFTLYSTAESRDLLETAHELERMAEVIGVWGLGSPTQQRSKVVLIGLPDKKSYAPHRLLVGGEPLDSAGDVACLPVGYWIGYREDEAGGRQVAHHEYAHTLIDERYQSVSLCLNEGLAEYLSTFRSTAKMCQLGEDIPGHRYLLSRGALLPLDELFAVTTDSPVYRGSGEPTQRFYGESWALVHYLMQTSMGGGQLFLRLMKSLADGTAPRTAFAAIYPRENWERLPERLQAYVSAGELMGPEIAFVRPLAELAVDLEAATPVEVAVHLGLWRAMSPLAAAAGTTALLQQGQADDALAPLAAAGLGLMAWAATDLDQALPLFRNAAAAKHADALTLSIAGLGVLQVASSRQAAVQDSLVLEANRILTRSVILDATDGKAQRGLEECQAFLRARALAGQAGSQPQDDQAMRKATIKYNAGIAAMNQRDYARARDAFTIVSESAPDSSLRAEARARIAAITDIEDFKRAIAAANAQDLQGALTIFERLAQLAQDPQLRSDAAANARAVRASLRHSQPR